MRSCAFLKVLLLSFYFFRGGINIFNNSKTTGKVNDVKFPVQLYQTREIGAVQSL